jgi:hypothetical protein
MSSFPLREGFQFVQVSRLVPLRDRAYQLAPLGEAFSR